MSTRARYWLLLLVTLQVRLWRCGGLELSVTGCCSDIHSCAGRPARNPLGRGSIRHVSSVQLVGMGQEAGEIGGGHGGRCRGSSLVVWRGGARAGAGCAYSGKGNLKAPCACTKLGGRSTVPCMHMKTLLHAAPTAA